MHHPGIVLARMYLHSAPPPLHSARPIRGGHRPWRPGCGHRTPPRPPIGRSRYLPASTGSAAAGLSPSYAGRLGRGAQPYCPDSPLPLPPSDGGFLLPRAAVGSPALTDRVHWDCPAPPSSLPVLVRPLATEAARAPNIPSESSSAVLRYADRVLQPCRRSREPYTTQRGRGGFGWPHGGSTQSRPKHR